MASNGGHSDDHTLLLDPIGESAARARIFIRGEFHRLGLLPEKICGHLS
jgi:hypothetical protein